MTETCEYADVVLPAPTFLEKEDLVISDSHQYTRLCGAVVEPLGESKPELWVIRELANKLKLSEEWLYEDHRMVLKKAFEGALVENDFSNLLSGEMVKIKERGLDEYQTPSGKIEFDSSVVEGSISSLPKQLMIGDEGDFILLNSSLVNWTHSQIKDVYRRASGRREGKRARAAALAGCAVAAAGLALIALPGAGVVPGIARSFALLLGLVLGTGGAIVLLGPALEALLTRLGGLPGKLASGFIRRSLGRTAVATAAFSVALSMSIGLGTLIGSFRRSLDTWMEPQINGDI